MSFHTSGIEIVAVFNGRIPSCELAQDKEIVCIGVVSNQNEKGIRVENDRPTPQEAIATDAGVLEDQAVFPTDGNGIADWGQSEVSVNVVLENAIVHLDSVRSPKNGHDPKLHSHFSRSLPIVLKETIFEVDCCCGWISDLCFVPFVVDEDGRKGVLLLDNAILKMEVPCLLNGGSALDLSLKSQSFEHYIAGIRVLKEETTGCQHTIVASS